MKFPIKAIGRYVGRAVGKEAGIIPDTTRFEITAEQRDDFVQMIAEGVYAALEQQRIEQEQREDEARKSYFVPATFHEPGDSGKPPKLWTTVTSGGSFKPKDQTT